MVTPASAAASASSAGFISGVWKAPATANRMVRPPLASTSFSTASQAATEPETTVLPGQSKLAIRIGPEARGGDADFLDRGDFVQGENADHAAGRGVGGRLHGLAARLHHAQPVGETQRVGERQRGVFAEAQAGRGDALAGRRGFVLAQRFEGGEAGDEQGRLADDGGIEPRFRPVPADVGEVVAENLRRLIVHAADGGRPCGKDLAHADHLRPWPGKRNALRVMRLIPYYLPNSLTAAFSKASRTLPPSLPG